MLCFHNTCKDRTATLARLPTQISFTSFRYQGVARLKADTSERTGKPVIRFRMVGMRGLISDRAHQVKLVLYRRLYNPGNIYNMVDVGFDLSCDRRTRQVGPVGPSSKVQTSLASSDPITVMAVIPTTDSPVPPFVIHPGETFQDFWLAARLRSPELITTNTSLVGRTGSPRNMAHRLFRSIYSRPGRVVSTPLGNRQIRVPFAS